MKGALLAMMSWAGPNPLELGRVAWSRYKAQPEREGKSQCTGSRQYLVGDIKRRKEVWEQVQAEKALHIRRRQEAWEEINGSPKAIGARAANAAMGKGDATEKSSVAFTKETAKTSGKDERTIRQAARRGKELGDDLHKIAGTSLDKGVEMDALIKMKEPERKQIIERAAKGEQVSARPMHYRTPIRHFRCL
ncbi:hypothetical protein ACKWRH_20905 [Bradyrhizobium sp. Pa8]|uniref:hypothetical protein n=1 Tax=Bradyrhizobium sp. Pa8 TaxID=3386552 RepID=UPI00403EF8CB